MGLARRRGWRWIRTESDSNELCELSIIPQKRAKTAGKETVEDDYETAEDRAFCIFRPFSLK